MSLQIPVEEAILNAGIQPASKAERRLRPREITEESANIARNPTRLQSRKAFETTPARRFHQRHTRFIQPASKAERRLRPHLPEAR